MDTTSTQPTYSALFVFGDSLSDNGAIAALTGGAIPAQVITGTDLDGNAVDFTARGIVYNGRFTNGDVYADIAAGQLGIASDTSTFYDNFSGSNFAVGNATATDLTALGGTATNTYADQVAAFQQAVAGLSSSTEEKASFLANAAASVFIGLNDLGALGGAATATGSIDQSVIATGVGTIVQQLFAQSQTLASEGVGTIILNYLPGGSFFPSSNPLIDAFGPETAELFDQVSAAVNQGIDSLAATLEANGINVEVVDFFSLAREVQADQETFGFLTLESLLPNGNADNVLLIDDVPIDQVGFIDPVHFTAELHEIFGAFQAMTLGNTQIDGDDGKSTVRGTADEDTIFARGGNDKVFAGGGNDMVFAGSGNDFISASAGDDVAFGGTGNDKVYGGSGGDVLSGGSGDDKVYGGSGNDVVAGNDGDDFVNGGGGDDVLTDGLGDDIVFAGTGNDIVVYRAAGDIGGANGTDKDLFFGGAGVDTLLIVTDDVIVDVDDFLASNNVQHFGFENVQLITNDVFDTYDFGTVGVQAEVADLFGLI